jgi:hypothetical protein
MTVLRSAASRVNHVVGPMVVLIGIAAAIAAVVLSLALGTAWFLLLLLPAALGIGGGLFVLLIARRARLQIDAEGFTWCGWLGAEQSLRWEQVRELLPPRPGDAQLVAVARLHDGREVPVRAVWNSPTSPTALLSAPDHGAAQDALLRAHRAWLAARR